MTADAVIVERVRALRDKWETALGDNQCPSCLVFWTGGTICDHEEGYHHALSDLRAVFEGGDR
jgi:hypothetical protein